MPLAARCEGVRWDEVRRRLDSSIRDASYSRRTIKPLVPAEDRLAIVSCKTSNPVIVLAEALSLIMQQPVDICRGIA